MEPGRIRAAVFIDFDNIFSGLLDLDPSAAMAFAQEPQGWLARLAAVGASDARRNYLVRRCYINPAGSRTHPALGPDRVFFSRYRPFFTKAGFEVIDCPSLTYRHKNAADIRICLDVVDTLSGDTRYDEYVIASGDSDFTPLLQRLRAADRRVTVIASSQTAVAYESVADLFLDEQEVIELMVGVAAGNASDALAAPGGLTAPASTGDAAAGAVAGAQQANIATFRAVVERALRSSSEPIHLSGLGLAVRSEMGSMVEDTDWFGYRMLTKAIRALDLPSVVVAGDLCWMNSIHKAPANLVPLPKSGLPEILERICRIADVPRLTSASWPKVFETLAAYATLEFKLNECTRWVRDELDAAGLDVGRSAINSIVHGATYGGCPVNQDPRPSAIELASAYFDNAVRRAGVAGLHLSTDEIRVFRNWVHPGISDEHLRTA